MLVFLYFKNLIKMANRVVVNLTLLIATTRALCFLSLVCPLTSEATPLFINVPETSNLIQIPDLPRIELPDIRYVAVC